VLGSFELAVNFRVPKVENWLIRSGCDACVDDCRLGLFFISSFRSLLGVFMFFRD
jgi:hypothetical protein